MSVHASVWVNCPDCDSMVGFQTHVGPEAVSYNLEDAPPDILHDIQGDWSFCLNCDTRVDIEVVPRLVGVAVAGKNTKELDK